MNQKPRALVALWLIASAVVSCKRHSGPSPPPQSASVEQRVSNLEAFINSQSPPVDQAKAAEEYKRDLAEIMRMGLVRRAEEDFSTHITNAVVTYRRIGYFVDTNVVCCTYQYHLPGSPDLLQEEFYYQRKTGTNWILSGGFGEEEKTVNQ